MKQEITISFECTQLSDLSEKDQNLIAKAKAISTKAYAPYSEFNVGATVLLKNGEIVLGSNQENIAYPSGLCAERVALFYAGANFPDVEVDTIYIVAKGELVKEDMNLSPCGGCRQVMVETEIRQSNNYRVILVNQDDSVNIFSSAKDLLPLTFGT